jgi:hypothetical protein
MKIKLTIIYDPDSKADPQETLKKEQDDWNDGYITYFDILESSRQEGSGSIIKWEVE